MLLQVKCVSLLQLNLHCLQGEENTLDSACVISAYSILDNINAGWGLNINISALKLLVFALKIQVLL